MSAPIIELTHLGRNFPMGQEVVHALQGIDLTIAAGELLVLMGASGSGKSTLLNIIGCLDQPSYGSYLLEGREVTELEEEDRVDIRRNRIGFIFQSFNLVGRMSALRNVELPMIFVGLPPGERRQRAREALVSVGLEHRLDHRPDQLSGGERQRVSIARAIAMEPPILLADEPTGNLDTTTGQGIIKLLLDLNERGKTIIMVTHDPELAKVGHRILRMRDGSFIQ